MQDVQSRRILDEQTRLAAGGDCKVARELFIDLSAEDLEGVVGCLGVFVGVFWRVYGCWGEGDDGGTGGGEEGGIVSRLDDRFVVLRDAGIWRSFVAVEAVDDVGVWAV